MNSTKSLQTTLTVIYGLKMTKFKSCLKIQSIRFNPDTFFVVIYQIGIDLKISA